VQDAETLGGAGQGDIELGSTARAVGEDPFWFHDQDGVELKAFVCDGTTAPGTPGGPDHDVGAFATLLVPHEFLNGSGQFVLGNPP